ncbi:helix-turn-helix domain-containing protein [Dyadobacter koreensis]|nr:AraC family transcriptional regulator [Dyadobacter koreensis]
MKERFQEVILRRMEPLQYIKCLQNDPVNNNSARKLYLSDTRYGQSEIYFEQINSGFWVLSLKTEEKIDSSYVYQPKTAKSSYYSINYYETRSSIGYQINHEIKWAKNIAVFSGPSTTYQIYVRKKVPVVCYRLVFSITYLNRLLNFAADNTPFFLIEDGNVNDPIIRITSESETMAIQKLHYLLKYAREDFNSLLSITASAFEITNLFFKASAPVSAVLKIPKADEELVARVIHELEAHLQEKFPGINALAATFYISPSKLKNTFKTIYHTTPLVYFRKLQMIYAYDVLNRKEMTIKELAIVLGFKKSSTFSIWFKRYTGKLPNEI